MPKQKGFWSMFGRPRILLDAREGQRHRGYHLLAAVQVMIRRRLLARLHVILDENPDVPVALTVFQAEASVRLQTWSPDDGGPDFDLYLLMADAMPQDAVTRAAMTRARVTLAGLMFPTSGMPPLGVVSVDGHDTAAYAEMALRMIGSRSRAVLASR